MDNGRSNVLLRIKCYVVTVHVATFTFSLTPCSGALSTVDDWFIVFSLDPCLPLWVVTAHFKRISLDYS